MGGLDNIQAGASSWFYNTGSYFAGACDLLPWILEDRIPGFFTEFITTTVPSRKFIILKLNIICWRKFVSELFSFCIEHLPNRWFVRSSPFSLSNYHCDFNPNWTFQVVMTTGMVWTPVLIRWASVAGTVRATIILSIFQWIFTIVGGDFRCYSIESKDI